MKAIHISCGPAVNDSETMALKQITESLESTKGSDEWLVLTNLTFSARNDRQSDEIDIVAIGPPGVRVVEVKHWAEAWVKRNCDRVIREAERVTEKAKKISSTLREEVENLPYVEGVFLVTHASWKVEDYGPVRGISFYTLEHTRHAIGLLKNGRFSKKVLSPDEVKRLGKALDPKVAVADDGTLEQMANYSDLVLQTPREQRFHRIYNATHRSRRERVKLHLYDLSASDNDKARLRAEREWRSLNRLHRYEWVPEIVDSFQDAPGYTGEIKFFTVADPQAPNIEQQAGDDSWKVSARLNFARDAVRALRELHEARSDGEQPMVHRNLTPCTILVKHDNSPIFTGFEQARIPAETTVALSSSERDWNDYVAPEVRKLGLGAADRRSDVYSLCASLAVLFKNAEEEPATQITEILSSGTGSKPQQRPSLRELDNLLSSTMGELILPPPTPTAGSWEENEVVRFNSNNYRIVSCLGSGGVGAAFKVVKLDRNTEEELGAYVAKAVQDKETGNRVLHSYELAHPHLRHSALSTIFEVATEWQENTFVALMTWLEGESLAENTGLILLLAEYLQQESGEALALGWLRNACEGLSVLHDNGLIHGDVSPRNMIVLETELVLMDYDCVTKIGAPARFPGTELYCSPSSQSGLDAAPADDLFALAASFFHVLFEKKPFIHGGNLNKELGLNWGSVNRDDYPLLSEFMDRATNPDPTKRFANVTEALSLCGIAGHTHGRAGNSAGEGSGGDADNKRSFMGRIVASFRKYVEATDNYSDALLDAFSTLFARKNRPKRGPDK